VPKAKRAAAEGKANGDSSAVDDFHEDWRNALRGFALALWRERAHGTPAARPDPDRLAALGAMAGEALGLVETFTLGALAQARPGQAIAAAPPEAFTAQLALVLKALEPSATAQKEEGRPTAPLIFQSELWQFLHKTRESAELSYAREFDLVELDRRILFLLRTKGPLVPAELSSSVGVDKAQVSRSVKRLLELKMVDREQIRSPVTLTRKGEQHADRMLRLADFFAAIELLLDRAVALYELARAAAQERGERDAEEIARPERRSNEPVLIDRARIISPLLTLSSYFGRSGGLMFKRRTGLSQFEAWVLNEIAMAAPIDWPTLTGQLQRDQSQAGRTVRALIGRGLVTREGRPGRRHGRFAPTAEGKRLYDIIQETSVERSSFLMAPLGEEHRTRFLAVFDKLRRNAVAQLERERALEELERE
jgi:DNA-binding MarR family transcriptional regulator